MLVAEGLPVASWKLKEDEWKQKSDQEDAQKDGNLLGKAVWQGSVETEAQFVLFLNHLIDLLSSFLFIPA